MHDSRNRFLLLLVAILALVFAPVAFAQDQGTAAGQQQQSQDTAQDQDQLQQRARDQIQLEDPDVEIAHNDTIDDDGNVTHDDRLRVETVFSSGPGWLVVFASSANQNQGQAGAANQNQGQDGFGAANQCGVASAAGQDTTDADADADDQDADADANAQATAAGDQALAQLGVVGYAHLQNGVNRGIEVPVDATRASQALCLQVHRDAGEIGVFQFPGPDSPVTGGLLINVIGGRLDDQGQLVVQDAAQDQDEDQDGDQDDDQDQNGDNGDDDDEDGDVGAIPQPFYLPLLPPLSSFPVIGQPPLPGGFPVIEYPVP